MRASHICFGCGIDLWRLRAPPDPVYHLPVVVCPGCGRAAVRGRDLCRRRRLLRCAILSLGLRLAALALVLGATLAVCAGFDSADFPRSRWGHLPGLWQAMQAGEDDPAKAFSARFALVALLAGGVVVGVWLRAGLGHWNPWPALAAWLGAGLLLISLPQALAGLRIAASLVAPAGAADALAIDMDLTGWIGRVEALLVLAAISPVGMLMVHSRRRIMASPSGRARRLGRRLARARRRRRRHG